MNNVELAKQLLTEALNHIESMDEKHTAYYNGRETSFYNAGIIIGDYLPNGALKGIVNSWKILIK